MMTAATAPERSAAFIWAFIERPSKARSADRPASRSASVRSRAWRPPVTSTTKTSSAGSGVGKASSASRWSRTRSMPEPNPMPGVSGPPSASARPL